MNISIYDLTYLLLLAGTSVALAIVFLKIKFYLKISDNSFIKQAIKLGLDHNQKQWEKNIIKSGFLNHLFGNWRNARGRIKIHNPKRAFVYKNYQVEILKFHIKAEQNNQTEKIGPYTGLHFNLNKKYQEVDIIYKKSDKLNKIFSLLTKNSTVKPRTWEAESLDFNKLYSILSNDQVLNLTALTPDVMARMIDSNLKLNIEIIDNHLLIYTSGKFKKDDELKTMIDIGYRIAENLE